MMSSMTCRSVYVFRKLRLSRKTIPHFVIACMVGEFVYAVPLYVGWYRASCLRCITIAVREGAHDNSPGCRSASASFSSAQWWVEGPSSQSVHVGGGADACGEEHKLHAVALASLTLVHLPQAQCMRRICYKCGL